MTILKSIKCIVLVGDPRAILILDVMVSEIAAFPPSEHLAFLEHCIFSA